MAGGYTAQVSWSRDGAAFTGSRYSRAHVWTFDGGLQVPASASPGHVPPGTSAAEAIDPEEALIAAISSCHMLFFLALASKAGFVVETYVDGAIGRLGDLATGRRYMKDVTLRPAITYAGREPTAAEAADLHHRSHDLCYIANSLTTAITVEPAI